MAVSFRAFVVAIAALLVAGALLFLAAAQQEKLREQRILFFTSALSAADAEVSIQAEGVAYRVRGSTLASADGQELTPTQRLSLYGLAYARLMAERRPLMALPGEDLEGLAAAIDELSSTQEELASKDPAHALLIAHLYPISFLRDAVEGERARRAFLVSGSREDAFAYDAALVRMLASHRTALSAFAAAFERAVQDSAAAYATADAVISKDGVQHALRVLAQDRENAEEQLEVRRRCSRGEAEACNAEDVQTPAFSDFPRVAATESERALARRTRTLLAEALGVPSIAQGPVAALSQSACTADVPGAPLFVEYRNIIAGEAFRAPLLVGDVRLLPTSDTVPYLKYFKSRGVEYVWYSPLVHYKCARVQQDAAAVAALFAVREFAQRSPFSGWSAADAAVNLRQLESALGGSVIEEADAAAYLSAGVRLPLPSETQQALHDLILRLAYRSGGLESVVREIALVERANLRLAGQGVPADVSAPRLFFSESGFVPLFLGDNGSFRQDDEPLLPRNALTPESEPYAYLSNLSSAMAQRIAADVTRFHRLYRSLDPEQL